MNNITFTVSNYSFIEKKILRNTIDKISPYVQHECECNVCEDCSVKQLCNDIINALGVLSEN